MGGVLPTDVTFGPDGVLYISDWVDGWPKSNKGRIYGITPGESGSGAGQVERRSRRTTRRRLQAGEQPGAHEPPAVASRPARAPRGAVRDASRRGNGVALSPRRSTGARASRRSARLHAVWGLDPARAHGSRPATRCSSSCSTTRIPKSARRRPRAWAISSSPRRAGRAREEARRRRAARAVLRRAESRQARQRSVRRTAARPAACQRQQGRVSAPRGRVRAREDPPG